MFARATMQTRWRGISTRLPNDYLSRGKPLSLHDSIHEKQSENSAPENNILTATGSSYPCEMSSLIKQSLNKVYASLSMI